MIRLDVFWCLIFIFVILRFLPFLFLVFSHSSYLIFHVMIFLRFIYHWSSCPLFLFWFFFHFINFHAYLRSPLGHVVCFDKHASFHLVSYPFFYLSLLWSFYIMLSHPMKFHPISWSFIRVLNFKDIGPKIWSLWKLAIWFGILKCQTFFIFLSFFFRISSMIM